MVGTILGDAGMSISSMAVGPSATGNTALMVLSTDGQIPDEALARLRGGGGHQRRPHRPDLSGGR